MLSEILLGGDIDDLLPIPQRKRIKSCPNIRLQQGIRLGTTTAQLASKSFWNMEMLQETLRQIAHDQAKNPIPVLVEETLPGDTAESNDSTSEVLPMGKDAENSSHHDKNRKRFEKSRSLILQRMWSINEMNKNGCLYSKSL